MRVSVVIPTYRRPDMLHLNVSLFSGYLDTADSGLQKAKSPVLLLGDFEPL
jgi:hypothetical protein